MSERIIDSYKKLIKLAGYIKRFKKINIEFNPQFYFDTEIDDFAGNCFIEDEKEIIHDYDFSGEGIQTLLDTAEEILTDNKAEIERREQNA